MYIYIYMCILYIYIYVFYIYIYIYIHITMLNVLFQAAEGLERPALELLSSVRRALRGAGPAARLLPEPSGLPFLYGLGPLGLGV